MKKIMLLMVLVLGLLSATGCNTVRGMGKDVEQAGDKIEDAVD